MHTSSDDKRDERPKGGFLLSLLAKLGLSSGAETSGAVGAGILGTKAGLVSLILAGSTLAAGVGLVGRSMMTSRPTGLSSVGSTFYAMLPGHSAASAGSTSSAVPPASPDGSSQSLQYVAEAARQDPVLSASALPADGSAQSQASSSAQSQAAAASTPPPSNAPGAANVSGAKTVLAKLPGLSAQNAGGSGGAGFAPALEPGHANVAAAANVGATSAMGREITSAGMGSARALMGSHGSAFGQLMGANQTGNAARQSMAPSMRSAGTTFDGASSSLSGPQAGTPGALSGGGPGDGPRDRYTPNQTTDQKDLPQPPKPQGTKNATPYQWAIYAALGAAAAGFIALFGMRLLKPKVEAAKASGNVAALASLLTIAKVLAGIAAAAGAIATVLGVLMATAWGQTEQGLLVGAVGGVLAFMAGERFLQLLKVGPAPEPGADESAEKMAVDKATPYGDKILKAMGMHPGAAAPAAEKAAADAADNATTDAAGNVAADAAKSPVAKAAKTAVASAANEAVKPTAGA